MRNIAIAFLIGMFAMAALARTCTAADAPDPAKEQDVRKLLDLSGAGKMGVQVMEQMTKAFRTQLPNVPPEFWDEMAKEMNAGEMINLVAPIYAKHFSHDEIKQLIAFYESPIGRRLVAEQPGIAAESMAVGQQWGQQLAAKMLQKLREKGFIPKA